MKLLMPAFSVAVMFAIVAATTFGADTVDDCAKPAGHGEQQLPTTDLPALQHVTSRATDCAPNQSPH
jgi:hypothetical protein